MDRERVDAVDVISWSRFFRFELAFFGEPQEVGFLHGLTDVFGEGKDAERFASLFAELPRPDLPDDSRVSFWFAEAGWRKYRREVTAIHEAVSERGWELVVYELDASHDYRLTVYQDGMQSAWPTSYVQTLQNRGPIPFAEWVTAYDATQKKEEL